jgi:hypothetical protein
MSHVFSKLSSCVGGTRGVSDTLVSCGWSKCPKCLLQARRGCGIAVHHHQRPREAAEGGSGGARPCLCRGRGEDLATDRCLRGAHALQHACSCWVSNRTQRRSCGDVLGCAGAQVGRGEAVGAVWALTGGRHDTTALCVRDSEFVRMSRVSPIAAALGDACVHVAAVPCAMFLWIAFSACGPWVDAVWRCCREPSSC